MGRTNGNSPSCGRTSERCFLAALEDQETVEIVLNADGTLWQERLGESLEPIGTMSASCADSAMRTIAAKRVFEKSHAGAILFSIRRIEARSIIVSEVCTRYS
jgi:hypothetical protein